MHKDLKNLWLPYTQMKGLESLNKAIKTKNSKIFLDNGTSLIDGIASWWTACHGYNNSYIKKKILKQLNIMPHVMFGGLIHDQAISLSKRLVTNLNNKLEKVFFSDSGSVSVEIALKMSIQFWLNKGHKNKNKFIFFKNGYHGDTSAAMAICDPDEGMHSLFKGYLNKNFLLKIPDNEIDKKKFIKLIQKNKSSIAGIIIEPLVQGAGGMKFHSASTLDFIYKIKKENDIVLIYDEIATGFYRTGTMFAFQQSNSIPDILCIGKALTGGFISLAATIASKKIFNAFLSNKKNREFMHGPTYMANPLACSAANASLDLFQNKNYVNIVKEIEKSLSDQLKKFTSFSFVKEVRVKGAIGVIELFSLAKKDITWLRKKFIKNGVWLRPLGNIVYFTPPLLISKKDLNYLTQTTYQIFKSWKK
jgi:adenosylmethionine---8-amino-7-oxononanoate aminotransferase